MNLKVLGVIPARYGSTRFPGKPLAMIAGKPMLQWVVEACAKSKKIDHLLVATDDNRIIQLAEKLNVASVLTDSECPTGSDRAWQAVQRCKEISDDCDVVVNIQGDEPLLQTEVLDALVEPLLSDKNIEMSTLARKFSKDTDILQNEISSEQTAKVVLNKNNEAIYFSRLPIPYTRVHWKEGFIENLCYKHIGLYGFRKSFLQRYCESGPCDLERMESLEQLRALYLGARIKVNIVDSDSWGVDTPEDVEKIETLLRKDK